MIIIDTDVLIEIFDKKSKKGEKALKTLEKEGEEVAITSITLHEILYGHYKRNKTIPQINNFTILSYKKEDAQMSSKIEYDLEKKGKKTGRIDTMIASIALNRNARLYTFNKKHFRPVEKLTLFG